MTTIRPASGLTLALVGAMIAAPAQAQPAAFGGVPGRGVPGSRDRGARDKGPRDRGDRRPANPRPDVGRPAPARLPAAARIVTAPVSVHGAPGSLEVVGVPVPAMFADSASVQFRISAEGRARVVGTTVGTLAGGARRSTVFVTVSAPNAADAGRLRVATAEFTAEGAPTVVVPVDLFVAATHRVEFAVVDQLVGARAGDAVAIRYRAVNFGNQAEAVRLDATLPPGWRLLTPAGETTLALGVRAAREGTLRVWVPRGYAAGLSLVRLVATAGGAPIASQDVRVEVQNETGGSSSGPGLTVSSVSVAAPGAPVVTALSAALEGSLTDDVRVSGRASWLPSAGSGMAQAVMARTGTVAAIPSLALDAPSFHVGLGLTGRGLSELTGVAVNGVGATGEYGAGPWRFVGLGMRPFTFGGPADSPRGLMVGGRVERQAGDATLSVTASRLDEPTFGRRLDAVGTGLTLRNGLVGDLTSEVGYRRSRTAQGLGWATELRRQGDAGALSLRLAHAPGGSLAYARAADELNAAASRRLTRALSVNGAYWRTADQGLGVGRMRSEGWSVGPGATLFGGLATLSLEARGNGFEAKSAAGGFGNAERQGVAGLDVRRGRFHMSGGATLANARRTTIVTGDTLPTLTGTRSEQRLFAGADLAGGSIEAGVTAQRFTGGAGVFPQQRSYTLRADRFAVPVPHLRPLLVGAEVQQVRTPWLDGGTRAMTTARMSATVPLPAGLGLTVGAERNPFMAGLGGGSPWMTTVRIDRLSLLPRLRSGTAGRVYRDLDGDGRRGRGEPGVAGLVVRCGERSVVTGRDGAYTCPTGTTAEVDARSLPLGWLPPARTGVARTARDVGLVAMAVARVQLVLDDVDSSRVSAADLAQVQVVARDSIGRPWVARTTSPGEAVFDALPPGRYTVGVDASAIAEPLRLMTADPVLVIADGPPAAPLRLALRGRATKVRVIQHAAAPAAAPRTTP